MSIQKTVFYPKKIFHVISTGDIIGMFTKFELFLFIVFLLPENQNGFSGKTYEFHGGRDSVVTGILELVEVDFEKFPSDTLRENRLKTGNSSRLRF